MKLYTVKEAAGIVGVSTNTLYKYLDEDRIHAARGSAIQGRFRIPESALEDFLGVKLSQPETTEPAVGATFTVARHPQAEGQTLEDLTETTVPIVDSNLSTGKLEYRKTGIPLKLARLFLFLALVAILVDLVISTSVSPISQLARLFFVAVMILLSYQEGGFRRS